ncbi:MAG: DUF4159 domain-containing protein [Actinomycetota bacterium]|nr:DUF4159 domain-containing protein [Actinomycetota bacterium]MDQ3901936.1 DUF4159 domain-containing protein [Actinomycetota bacterium]
MNTRTRAAGKVAVLDMDIRHGDATDWSDRVDRLDCYAIGSVDLAQYPALIVTPNADQEHLARQQRVLRDYLERGGVVVFGGHLHRDWLPGASAFVPLTNRSLDGYRVVEVADHPIFRGMGTEMTFRRGVAGFFARGHHPLPPGAEVLTRLFGGEPATYLDRVSTAGTIVVQATSDLLSYCGEALLDWIIAESAQRRAQAAGRLRGLATVYGGSSQHHRTFTEPKYAQHLTGGMIYLPELADTDLTEYCGLLIPERLHRGQLDRAADRVLELLDAGGTVIAFSGGEPIPEFLPGVRWQHRPTNFWWWLEPDADLGVRLGDEDHPLFRRLTLDDCTWHYHGVLHPPEGAQVLVRLTTGEALLYVDRVSTRGTVVVSTLDPISHYGGYFMPATGRFLDAFLPWAAETSLELATRFS